jgi:hypothetical protein
VQSAEAVCACRVQSAVCVQEITVCCVRAEYKCRVQSALGVQGAGAECKSAVILLHYTTFNT